MKRFIFLLIIFSAILLLDAKKTFAQEQASARYQSNKMIEISDLISADETEDCTAKRYVGTVAAIQYASKTQVESFTLKAGKSTVKVYFSPMLYTERLTKKDARSLPALIAKGKKITVDTYICGASGKIIMAMYILAGSHPETLG